MQWRFASSADIRRLAELNHQLIADEGHGDVMDVAELEHRMQVWLATQYKAVLFHSNEEVVAYALFRDHEGGGAYLRHFFVVRTRRRQGIGRHALQLLARKVLSGRRLVLDVLSGNAAGRAFWAAVGFREYAVLLERDADAVPQSERTS
ncbi:MAG TPA: GNAT family N-acetyltransferase [Polyangiaceae bacterium]